MEREKSILSHFSDDEIEIIVTTKRLILDGFEDMWVGGTAFFNKEQRDSLESEIIALFAKCALSHLDAKEWFNTDDISILENPAIHKDRGIQVFVSNIASAILTLTTPVALESASNHLCELRFGANEASFEFDIPANTSIHKAFYQSFNPGQQGSDVLKLRPLPVGVSFEIIWSEVANGKYSLSGNLLEAVICWCDIPTHTLAKALAKADKAFIVPQSDKPIKIAVDSNNVVFVKTNLKQESDSASSYTAAIEMDVAVILSKKQKDSALAREEIYL